jgi:dTDP-4-dehydrorhamnose reductase
LTHQDVEIADYDVVAATLQRYAPEFVVNTAAMHHVEQCEANPARAFAVNGVGARNLSRVSKQCGAAFLHVSTDYVFDGVKRAPYVETDRPAPLNAYGITKLAGEYFTSNENPKCFVLRTSAIYGHNPCRAKNGLNFVELMLKLGRERGEVRVVDSEEVSPTPAEDIAAQICALSRSDAYGLYHGTAEGSCSWYQFAKEIFSLTGTNVRLIRAGTADFPAKVLRPAFSVLENAKLKKIGLNMFRPWQQGLQSYLNLSKPAVAV